MPRIRYLKPDFFKDEDIATLPFECRLFYEGLWVFADKAGRLEDRPARLKAEIFPYDNVDAEKCLDLLSKPKSGSGQPFINRYATEGQRFIQINTFLKHQRPHHPYLFTISEKDAFPFAAGDADIGVCGFAGTVDYTAHNGYAQAREPALFVFYLSERLLDFISNTYDVHFCPTARRAGEDFRAEPAKAEPLDYIFPDDDFLDRVSCERDADRVAYPLRKQIADTQRGLDRAGKFRSGSRDAQMERVIAFFSHQAVRVYRLRDI